jgi:hypothetical protein
MPRISQTQRRANAAKVVAGIRKRLPRNETYMMNGKAFSHEELVAFFQEQVDVIDAVKSARSALAAAIAKDRVVARRMVNSRLAPFRYTIANRFASRVDALADFGWTMPKKPGPKTLAGKVAGQEKARATRKARAPKG